jgi:hypothetical protein
MVPKGEKSLLLAAQVSAEGGAPSSMGSVLAALIVPATVVTVAFMTTLSCFPGLTTSLDSRTLALGDWFPVLLVFFLNTFDLVGKSLPSVCLLFDKKTLPFAALAHVFFIPAFLVVARRPSLEGTWGFLGTDEFAMLLVAMLGLSTGYVCTCAMMLGPGCVEPKDRVLAGQMMSSCLLIGLFAGSVLGLALLSLVPAA